MLDATVEDTTAGGTTVDATGAGGAGAGGAGAARPPGAGRQRLHEAALRLFAEHGVSGTSLQMIADAVGVTKAAVYYHYRTKDELVVGLVSPFLDRVDAIVDGALEHRSRRARVEAVIDGLTAFVVEVRRLYVVSASDPAVAHLLAADPRMQQVSDRLRDVLAGPDADVPQRLAVVFFLAGLVGPLTDEGLRAVDDETLRRSTRDLGRRLLLTRRRPTA